MATLQLYLNDQEFYCLLRYRLYYKFGAMSLILIIKLQLIRQWWQLPITMIHYGDVTKGVMGASNNLQFDSFFSNLFGLSTKKTSKFRIVTSSRTIITIPNNNDNNVSFHRWVYTWLVDIITGMYRTAYSTKYAHAVLCFVFFLNLS